MAARQTGEPLLSHLIQQLRDIDCLDRPLVAAVSGGPDSMALLGLLVELRRRRPELVVCAAHVHHGLRGEEADLDEQLVRDFCEAHHIEFVVGRLRVTDLRGNLEAAARRLRYDFLAEVAAARQAVVLTGHTLDDQAETFLLKLCRGAGPSGLSGIRRRRRHRAPGSGEAVLVVRPLLDVPRRRLAGWLELHGIPSRTDQTNLDLRLRRNWLRHRILPELAEHLNPAVKIHLSRTAGLLAEVDDFLGRRASALLKPMLRESGPLGVPVRWLAGLHPALRREVVRRLLGRLAGARRPAVLRAHVEQVCKLVWGQSGKELVLPGGVRAERSFDQVWFRVPEPVGPFGYRLALPGEVVIPELGIRVGVEPAAADADFHSDAAVVTVRNRRPGDRVPMGKGEFRRLKRFLMERRIPRWKRERLLIVEEEGKVLWVEGLELGRPVRPAGPGWKIRLIETFRDEEVSK
ncbi:MAG: tRNA lysidine(34) synthetase TilS [Acidobacteriota bacterium]